MSKIALTPNASGTGTFTLAAPNSNTSRTITLPDEAGEVLVNGTNQNVGIGTSSPSVTLDVTNNSGSNSWINASQSARFYQADSTNPASIKFQSANNANGGQITWGGVAGDGPFVFRNYSTERMRIDSSGNLLVGTSNQNWQTEEGMRYFTGDSLVVTRSSATPFSVNRLTDDGDLAVFRKDGSTVGSIGVAFDQLYIHEGEVGLRFRGSNNDILPVGSSGSTRDNAIDLGRSETRFDDIYATNGTIQTSDRNEKQDIEALNDAETRVAQACKGLLRKFRWQDAVAEKGDDARIHFGIIAQDLQDAFAAEGLDAGRYAMFISSTWWETQTEVPAVEAVAEVLDDDGNVVTEAVEAKDAYTRTDTYETQAEAPEGATERTRLGVRYPELLAFIIGAM